MLAQSSRPLRCVGIPGSSLASAVLIDMSLRFLFSRATQTLLDPTTKALLTLRASEGRRARQARIRNLVMSCEARRSEQNQMSWWWIAVVERGLNNEEGFAECLRSEMHLCLNKNCSRLKYKCLNDPSFFRTDWSHVSISSTLRTPCVQHYFACSFYFRSIVAGWRAFCGAGCRD